MRIEYPIRLTTNKIRKNILIFIISEAVLLITSKGVTPKYVDINPIHAQNG